MPLIDTILELKQNALAILIPHRSYPLSTSHPYRLPSHIVCKE